MVTAKKSAVKKTVKRTTRRSPPKQDFFDKVIDLIKWIDSPFKLVTVVLISFIAFAGYFAWDSRQVILSAIAAKKTEMKEVPAIEAISKNLLYDLSADVVVVLSNQGRDKALEGSINALFTSIPEHNKSVITMFQGEVSCEPFVPASKLGDFAVKHGVTYMCRGSVPPEMGRFVGYIAVGFAVQPKDVAQVKARINLASTEMAK